tara:strand:- start:188 stop:778 length:591 start_codon:yes stop_codon:yes gene_type:complete
MALDQYCEFNKRKGVTHTSTGRVEFSSEHSGNTEFSSHFCFPLDYQFIAKDEWMHSRPTLLMQVNSVDSWNRHRIEGYGFCRFPLDPGYHQIEVDTWRPRASLDCEIHSFFLGGSVRIQKLEELVATSYINANGESDVVNRFGLETEEGGKIKLNINICTQDIETRKRQRQQFNMLKEKEKLETRKLVMKYTLALN